jgi:hypothetical protein
VGALVVVEEAAAQLSRASSVSRCFSYRSCRRFAGSEREHVVVEEAAALL